MKLSTNGISSGALQAVGEGINTTTKRAKAIPIVVYNPLGWKRSGAIRVNLQLPAGTTGLEVLDPSRPSENGFVDIRSRDKNGVVEFSFDAIDIPALGYKVYQLLTDAVVPVYQIQPRESADAKTSILENDLLRVVVDRRTGCITELFYKKTNFEALAPGSCGNQLQFFKDTPKDYDAWNIDPGTLDQPPMTIETADSVDHVLPPDGPDAIVVVRHWQNSKFVQTITLGATSDIVDVENDFDWHEAHVLLKASFSVAATSDFATYEIPFGQIDRPTTRNNSWEKAQFEVPAMRWVDLGDGKHGLSILNRDKYGYDAVGNQLRITLLRSPKWPDPEVDMGHQHFHYAIYPHEGTWKDALTVRRGWEYDYPLQAVVTTAHAGSLPASQSFASASPENVVLTAVKKAEDANGLIFRVYEWAGKASTVEFHVPKGAKSATVTNLMEKPEGQPLTVAGDVVKAPIKPYEILTVRVDY